MILYKTPWVFQWALDQPADNLFKTLKKIIFLSINTKNFLKKQFQARKLQMAEEMREAAGEDEQDLANEMAAVFLDENLPENVFGAPKAGSGNWASCIRIMDPIRGRSIQKIKLDQNEAAMR